MILSPNSTTPALTNVSPAHRVAAIQHAIHKRFIWLVLSSYIAAALWPGLGLWLRNLDLGAVEVAGSKIELSLPPALLAFLLFNAGISMRTKELAELGRHPRLLAAGIAGNVFAPAVSVTMKLWHNPEEVQQILTGLALIAAMPIAGASTAWAQNANSNLALSLGLVVLTTLLSPVLAPVVLHSVGFLATGDYSEDLHELAFGAGYLISRQFRADRGGMASLMFGLGMNNNGAGLVLASLALSDHPAVMIPVIVYNLVQHLVASLVDKTLSVRVDRSSPG